jgi:hypothetical protein
MPPEPQRRRAEDPTDVKIEDKEIGGKPSNNDPEPYEVKCPACHEWQCASLQLCLK